MLTTRALIPSALSISYASTQSATSLPVAKQQNVRPAVVCIRENIGAASQTIRRRVFRSVQRWHRLTSQYQRDRFVAESRNDAPCLHHFIGIGWSQGDKSWDRAQRCQMLDWLVCRPIFPELRSNCG